MNTTINVRYAVLGGMVLAWAYVLLVAAPAYAQGMPPLPFGGEDNDIKVSISNSAEVFNMVKAEALTGDNKAIGGDGEEGGHGGDAEGKDVDNTAGAAGAGGSGAPGGIIVTGNAAAYATLLNEINTTKVRVSDYCGCDGTPSLRGFSWLPPFEGPEDNDIRVRISNEIGLKNIVKAEAVTGDNLLVGGDGEEGGNGGDAESKTRMEKPLRMSFFGYWPTMSWDDNVGGAGGVGGSGGMGGEIYTGTAVSGADVVNVLNTTMTRVRRL